MSKLSHRYCLLGFLLFILQLPVRAISVEESVQISPSVNLLGQSMAVASCVDTTLLLDSICSNSYYLFDADTLRSSGQFEKHYTSHLACDSVVILSLTVLPAYNIFRTDTLCNGGFYNFGTNVLVSSGIYQNTFQSISGCDSIVTLTLTNQIPIVYSRFDTICKGRVFNFEGMNYTQPGIYPVIYRTPAHCDSLVELHLHVVEPKYTYLTDSFCAGTSYQFVDTVITSAGVYRRIYVATSGCDSIVELNLSYKGPILKTQPISICQGGSYTFVGNIFKTAGVYSHTFTSSSGCDSIVTLNLTVRPPITAAQSAVFCAGSIYNFGGDMLSQAGVYTHMFQTSAGCDSIVTLNLQQLLPKNVSLTASICPSESFQFGNRLLKQAGVYVDKLVSGQGCDSIVTLTLKYSDPVKTNVVATTCKNQPYTFGVKKLTLSGTYTLNTQTTKGCDSLVTLKLKVYDTYKTSQSLTLNWDEVYEMNNNSYNKEGVYTDVLQTVNACDSVVVTTITYKYDNAPAVVVPKFFTPNDDGVNDRLEIKNMDLYPRAYIEIVDRQGKLLYRMKSGALPWDGKYNGYAMPPTDYWYKVEVPETNKQFVGHFLLKR